MRTTEVVISFCLIPCLIPPPCFSQSALDRRQQIELHNRNAQEYLRENKPDLALPELKTVVALDPNNVDAQGNLGVLMFFRSEYTDAIPHLRAALKLRPTLWKIQALLGMGEKRTGDITSARGDLETAFPKLQEQKIRMEMGMELIEIYSGTGDLGKAAATVSVLRDLDPTNVDLLYIAYRIHSDLAGEAMLSLSVVAPESARMHQLMAHELARQGKAEEAIANYRIALKIDPQLPGLHYELAEMLNTSSIPDGREEAEGEYKAALAVNPFDEKSECRLGDLAAMKGDMKGAYEHYERAVRLQPNDPEANIGLAKTLMSMNQPQKAEPLLEHAVQLDPTSAVAHFRLSTVYRQAGRTAEAKRELEEYQKYKDMKEKLRELYKKMRLVPEKIENEDEPRN
jgi:tetratricopeptide (TPR) repeat protein